MVCEYDLHRLENIERNRKILLELGVFQVRAAIEPDRRTCMQLYP